MGTKVHFPAEPTELVDGRFTRPRLLTFLTRGRHYHEINLWNFSVLLRGYGLSMIPCPFAQDEQMRTLHKTEPTGQKQWRAVVGGSGSLVESARVSVEKCVTCNRSFLHTNPQVLALLPAEVQRAVDVEPDATSGVDSDYLFTPHALVGFRARARMRQGGLNEGECLEDRVGVEYAARMQEYTERGRAWLSALIRIVGDGVWEKLPRSQKAALADARGELLAFYRGSGLEVPPGNPSLALHSPLVSGYDPARAPSPVPLF